MAHNFKAKRIKTNGGIQYFFMSLTEISDSNVHEYLTMAPGAFILGYQKTSCRLEVWNYSQIPSIGFLFNCNVYELLEGVPRKWVGRHWVDRTDQW